MSDDLAKGDYVRATYQGRSVKAIVLLASPNGRSLIISWMATGDGMLGGHAGTMPILRDAGGYYYSLMEGEPVTLERIEAATP